MSSAPADSSSPWVAPSSSVQSGSSAQGDATVEYGGTEGRLRQGPLAEPGCGAQPPMGVAVEQRVVRALAVSHRRRRILRPEMEVDIQLPASVAGVRSGVDEPQPAVGRDEDGQQSVDDRLQILLLLTVELESDR